MVGPVSAPSIRSRSLCCERIGFFASPKLGIRGRNVSLNRLVAHTIITFSRTTQPFVDVAELLSDPALPQARVHASASVATIVRMALDGVGIAILPASIVADDVKRKALIEIHSVSRVPDLKFVAGWLAASETGMTPTVIDIAAAAAQGSPRKVPSRTDKSR